MLVHHWDTDGITSAAIYIKVNGEDELFTPKIGNFYLDEEDFKKVSSRERVVILDMNLPDAPRLCENSEVYIYDHHRATRVECAREHCNPYLEGKHYPSCTTVLMERFSYREDYLVALGIIGDKGPKAREIEEWKIVEKVISQGVKYEDLQKAVDLLDSSFKLDRRDEVIENVHLALQGLDAILNEERLHRNLERIEREIEMWAERAEDRGSYYFLVMKSPYHIISSVTRRLAWDFGKAAIVVNEKNDRDEFYIRSPAEDFNALPLIEIAKEKGYRAGGKREVMGAILPRGEGKRFAEEVLEVLKW